MHCRTLKPDLHPLNASEGASHSNLCDIQWCSCTILSLFLRGAALPGLESTERVRPKYGWTEAEEEVEDNRKDLALCFLGRESTYNS